MKTGIVKTKQPRLVVYCICFSSFVSPEGAKAQSNKTGVHITTFYFTICRKMSIIQYNTWFQVWIRRV